MNIGVAQIRGALLQFFLGKGALFLPLPDAAGHPGKGAKLDCVIQLNCGEVLTHASYNTTRT